MAFGDIVLLRNRTALGPYTRAQIQEGLGRGDISGRDLAHTPGLKNWFPLLEVLHHLDREPMQAPRPREPGVLPPLPSAPPVPDDPSISADARPLDSFARRAKATTEAAPNATWAEPSHAPRDLPSLPTEKSAPSPLASGLPPWLPSPGEKTVASPAPTASPPSTAPADLPPRLVECAPASSSRPPLLPQAVPPLSERVPAPLRRRFLAWAIDWAVLFVPVLLVFAFAYVGYWIRGPLEHRDPETARQEQALLWRNLRELLFMVAIGFAWIYAAGLESSRWQGTVGKQCMGLIVTDEAGHRLGFLRATGRHAAKYLSALPLFLGFMAALANPQRLTWHDRLAGTRVVER